MNENNSTHMDRQDNSTRMDKLAARREADAFHTDLKNDAASGINPDYIGYVQSIQDKDLESTILIEAPAFCEADILNTVQSALMNAAMPSRIHFAICLQDDDMERKASLEKIKNCRVKHFSVQDAPGTCAARYEASLLYQNEDYVLHIDGHMRFARYWDVCMIEQWRNCHDPKAIVSAYCLSCKSSQAPDDEDFTKRAEVNLVRMHGCGFGADIWNVDRNGVMGNRPQEGAWPGAVVSGHMQFMRPEADRDCPVDPNTFFSADEVLMAVRFFTHGYNIYCPTVQCIYHRFRDETNSADKGRFNPDRARRRRQEDQEMGIALQLLGVIPAGPRFDGYPFGLGTERTLGEYQAFSGIDFRHMTTRDFTDKGDFRLPHDHRDMGVKRWDPMERWHDGNSDVYNIRVPRYTAARMMDEVRKQGSSVSAVATLALTYYFAQMDRRDMPTFLNGMNPGTDENSSKD